MKVSGTPLALLCACFALELAVVAAEYMYRPAHGPPHLGHGHGLHGPLGPHGPHKHHPYASGKAPGGGPGKHPPPRLPPPPHYHGRPMHRPRKPPPPPLAAASPWKSAAYKTTAFKTTKEPFLLHGADADFGSPAAALSASKVAGTQLTSITGGSSALLGGSVAPSHASAVVRPSLAHAPHALHTYTNVVSDDRGPIHTIPAPQLSPADRPSHLAESQAYAQAEHQQGLHQGLQQALLQRQAIQSALSQLSAAQAARPTTIAPVLHHTQGYQVSEPSTAAQTQDGAVNLYAPDPDPSRPALKVRPTTDPYSLPSEGRGPHFSIDPQFGAVSSQPGYMSASLSPQDLFHLLNGFPLQGLQGLQPLQQDVHGVHGVQPHIQIMPHGLTGDTLTAEHQHLLLQQQHQQQHLQHLQQQQYQQQVQAQAQAQAAQSIRQLQSAPQYQSFDFDEQAYQHQDQQDHEVSEDAPRPSVQRPDAQDASASASTVSLFTVAPPQPTSSTPPHPRADQDEAEDDADQDEVADDDDYEEAAGPSKHWASSTTQAQPAVTPAPQASASLEDDDDALQQQVVVREEAGSYASDPSLVTPFRRQPNSVQVAEAKVPEGKPLPYGARIRPKRVAAE